MISYDDFIKSKSIKKKLSGFDISLDELSPILFPYQKDIIRWNLLLGKSADFTMTGTGKTLLQLEFGRVVHKKTGGNVLIVAPLAVNIQTIEEAKDKLNLEINNLRHNSVKSGINIINYDRLDHINPKDFNCVILDESSILKNYSGDIRNKIIKMFEDIDYKLCCTATPAPNDYMELGNHAEFLDVMKRTEMLSTFFVHDGGETSKWRLKKHAEEDFWKWVSSWAAIMTKPSDLDYSDENYILPELNIKESIIESSYKLNNSLFSSEAKTLAEVREVRKNTIDEKVKYIADKINNSNEIFIVWCDLNSESEALKKAIKDSYEIKGSDEEEYKEKAFMDFAKGKIKCLITKAKIAGMGMNFQICHNMMFCGIGYSFEYYFQAVRRCWRFGQKYPVNVEIVTTNLEGSILDTIHRKERDAINMIKKMVIHTKNYVKNNIKVHESIKSTYFAVDNMILPKWL